MAGAERLGQADALAVARNCADRLRTRFGAERVIIFGSVTGDTPWHGRSDIDLAVEGLPPELFWRAWADLSAKFGALCQTSPGTEPRRARSVQMPRLIPPNQLA